MTPYQNYFPTGYQNPYQQQPFQAYQQANFNQQPQQVQNFSQPTIRAEIVQISGDYAEAENFPVSTGGTQMMINRAGDKIFIKTVYANNQSNVDVFVKQAPAPAQQQPNFDNFVTWDMLEKRLSELQTPAIPKKKEETINE